jgi:hypothetical protein
LAVDEGVDVDFGSIELTVAPAPLELQAFELRLKPQHLAVETPACRRYGRGRAARWMKVLVDGAPVGSVLAPLEVPLRVAVRASRLQLLGEVGRV